MKAPSLRTKFVAGSLGLVLLLGFGTIVLVRAMLTDILETQLQKRALFLARAFAEEVVDPILTENVLSLRMLCVDHKIPESDIEYIFVVTPKGEVTAHTFGESFPSRLKEANIIQAGQAYSIRHLTMDTGSVFDIAAPILKGDLGTVRVGISAEPIGKSVSGIINHIVWIIISFAAFVSIIAIVFSVRITKPFAEFVKAAKTVGSGDLGYRIPIKAEDEIGQLTATFNMMVNDLQKTTVSRTQLEGLMHVRTAELSRTNNRLVTEIEDRMQAERTLKDINAKLEALIHAIPDAVFFKDCSGRYLLVNRAFEKIAGANSEMVIGKSDEELISPELAESCRRSDEALLKSGRPLQVDDIMTGRDGKKRFLDTVKAPIHDLQGNLLGLVGVSRDVTERRSADEMIRLLNRRNEMILKSAGEGICGIDLDGIITFANPAAARLTGWNVSEIIGKHQHSVLHHSRLDGSPYPGEDCPISASLKDGVVHQGTDEVFWRKDGSSFPVEYISTPITEEGRITGAVLVFKDISERKQIEESLKAAVTRAKEAKARTESIIAAIGDGINIQDRDFKVLYQNQTSIGFYGHHIGEYCYKAFQNKEQVCEPCHLTMSFRDGKIHTLEQQRTTESGTFHYEITASPLRDASGNIVAGIELIREITGRKEAEERLKTAVLKAQEEQAKSEAIIAAIGDQMVILDNGFRIIYQNHLANQTIGDHTGEVCYKAFENREAVCDDCPVELTFRDGMVHRGERIAPSIVGTLHLDITASPLKDSSGKVIAVIEMVRDITARKEAEESLLLFRNLIDQSKDAILVNDPATGRFLMVNDRACSNLGYDRTTLLNLGTMDIEAVFPDQASWDAHVHEVKSKGYLILEGMNRRRDRTLFPVEVNVTYMTLGAKDYMLAVVRDITERKLADQALRTSQERLSKAQKTAHVGNWEWDVVTNKLYWSEEVYRIYGVDPEEYVPTFESVGKAMHPDDAESFINAVNAALYERKSFELDYRLIRPDGTVRTVHTIGEVFYDPEGKPLIKSGTIQDITEQKEAEEALRKSHEDLEILVAERTAELTMMNEQLRSFSSYLQEAREKERASIAREIHDELGQAMTALKMDFAWLKKKTPPDRKDLVEKEASMSDLIETTMESVKRIATELRPGILDHLGLAAAVEWQAEEFEKRTGIKCSIVFRPDEIILDRDRSTTIFRVFQETLTNIARHAKATKVAIGLTGETGEFMLRVKDNGKGITEKQISDRKSLGLIGIRERVYFWGGSVTITGSRTSGTENLCPNSPDTGGDSS